MKEVLISFVGLSRTFKKTYKNIYDNLIKPNKETHNFNIILNTDYKNGNTTRRDYFEKNNKNYIKPYEEYYNTEEDFINDLKNTYKNIKEIYINNSPCKEKCHCWTFFYKRTIDILELEYQKNNIYDIYIVLRFDIVIDNIINLSLLDKNNIYCIPRPLVRNAYFHNKDILDILIIGYCNPFMLFVHSIFSVLNLTNKFIDHKGPIEYWDNNKYLKMLPITDKLIDHKKKICSNDIIDIFNKNEIKIYNINNVNFNIKEILFVKNQTNLKTYDNYGTKTSHRFTFYLYYALYFFLQDYKFREYLDKPIYAEIVRN